MQVLRRGAESHLPQSDLQGPFIRGAGMWSLGAAAVQPQGTPCQAQSLHSAAAKCSSCEYASVG